MPRFEYRLVRLTYMNRIEYEDGPGSLMNIVSDEPRWSTIRTWPDEDEQFGERLVKEGVPFSLSDSAEGGRIDYSYELQRRADVSAEWEYVGHVRSAHRAKPRDWYDLEREEDDREE